jgi:hypothetical protein
VTLRGVPRTVVGRLRREGDNRVRYEEDGRLLKSEELVRRRCLRAGWTAVCLPPTIWRVLGVVERLEAQSADADLLDLVERAGALRPRRMGRAIEAVRTALPAEKRKALVARHGGADVNPKRPGTPDLLAYRERNGVPYGVRFVEVKRGGQERERLKPHQLSELRFLKSLGFKAGVLRLEPRPAASTPAARRTR